MKENQSMGRGRPPKPSFSEISDEHNKTPKVPEMPSATSTPDRTQDGTSKRDLSSPFDNAEVNPTKKNKLPDLSLDSSLLSKPPDEGAMECMSETPHAQSQMQTFHLADSDLQKVAAIVQMALHGQVQEMVKDIVKGVTASFSDKVKTLETENEQLKTDINLLKEKVNKLEVERDSAEQYSRRNSLRISGLPVGQNENTDKIVLEIASAINCDISPSDIDRSHRVGKMRRNNTKDLIIKFATYRARERFIRARNQLKGHTLFGRVFINEDLTKRRSDILYSARQLRNDDKVPIVQVWSWDGRIFVKNSQGECHLINSESDLETFKV